MKKYYSEKKPTKLSWPMGAKSDKSIFYSKRKKTTKLSYPMSAKYDTQLPGFIYNKISIFLDCLKNFSS